MANNDFETLAKSLMGSKAGKNSGASLEKLGELLKTEDGQRLLTLLANGGSDTIKTAAQAALRGDENSAKLAMMSLLGTREGAILAKHLKSAMNDKK